MKRDRQGTNGGELRKEHARVETGDAGYGQAAGSKAVSGQAGGEQARQEQAGREQAGQGRAGQENAGQEQTGQGRAAQTQTGQEQTGGHLSAGDGRFPVWQPGMPIAPFIDHTLLRADARPGDFAKLCEEALEHRFYSVCVNGRWVRQCREQLSGTDVKVCSVVGFPLGAGATRAKAFEAAAAVEDGASEIDMVLPLGRLLDADYAGVEKDIASVVQAVQGGALVKVILETGALTDELIAEACRLAEAAEADYVKTSTGFGPGGATEAHVRLMRASVSPRLGVKASGGIRSAQDAVRMLLAGASRIGTSSGIAIASGVDHGGQGGAY